MMIQGRSSLTCVAPDSGDKGVWDGEPPTCKSVAAERLNQFEGMMNGSLRLSFCLDLFHSK